MSAVHTLGSWRTESDRYARVAGQWRRVVGMAAHVAGAWRTVAGFVPAFSASAPAAVYGSSVSGRPAIVSAAVTISGGASPYSYQWTFADGDARVAVTGATMATASFSATLYDDDAEATFTWTATDAAGQTASGSVDVTLTAYNLGDRFQ